MDQYDGNQCSTYARLVHQTAWDTILIEQNGILKKRQIFPVVLAENRSSFTELKPVNKLLV